jgi:hypothetical protein
MADFKIPPKLGAVADLLYRTREARLRLSKECDALKERETALSEHLIRELPKSDASGVSGRVARATAVTKVVPTTEDWDALYRYVKRTGAFELLQKRLTAKAVEERWEAGKEVPGVGRFRTVVVSLSKL